MNGILLIDKDETWTSRDVCNKISKILNVKKVGHCGTLDPFATGLMIIGVDKGTKALSYFKEDIKEYEATLVLGKRTSTGDKTGEIIEEKKIEKITKNQVLELFQKMIGKSTQIPPMTSAIHHNGIKLYKLARQGIEVERQPRNIEIFDLKLLDLSDQKISFRVKVSKGTYIRVLGEDIAKNLKNIGFLQSLRRICIENLNVSDAIKIGDVSEEKLLNVSDLLVDMKHIHTDDYRTQKIKNGLPFIYKENDNCNKILFIDKNNNAIAVYKREKDDKFICERGLW